jgi:hypothetical protein
MPLTCSGFVDALLPENVAGSRESERKKSQVPSSGEFFGFFGGHPETFLGRVYFYTPAYAQSLRFFFSNTFLLVNLAVAAYFSIPALHSLFPSVISYNGDKFYQALDW